MAKLLSVEEAQSKICTGITPHERDQTLALVDSHQRVLAEDILSPVDVPPADNSAMDGYAINNLSPATNSIALSQRIPAGQAPYQLAEGTAARIFTGAEIPPGANAVVMQENCRVLEDNSIEVLKAPFTGENIRRRGQDILCNSVMLRSGQKLEAQHIGLLASVGIAKVKVFAPMRVSIVSTGDELVEPGTSLAPGQIYNSNSFMLQALLTQLGCTVTRTRAVADTLQATQAAFSESIENADLVISSGGVSVGEEDYVKASVESIGRLNLWKVNIKPGKPLAFGSLKNTPFLGLPGNPVSAFVTFVLFGIPLIHSIQGRKPTRPVPIKLPAAFATTKAKSRREYVRVQIKNGALHPYPNQSSGVLSSVCWSDALALIPEDQTVSEGQSIEVLPYPLLFA